MRSLTEALLRGNSAKLTELGWKPEEQRRCFKKADAMLDYIARIKPGEYVQETWYKKLNEQRVEGLKYCLQKDMPSKVMQGRSLEVLKALLSLGNELFVRSAWLYRNYPALFKVKYAASPQLFQKDACLYFVGGRVVPENSFPPFKKGENPVLQRDNSFLNRCIEMYNDPLFETPEYQQYAAQPVGKKYPFIRWVQTKRAGKRFWGENQSLNYVIGQLATLNAVELRLDKQLANIALHKKQKTK